jgi:hypothetical protein
MSTHHEPRPAAATRVNKQFLIQKVLAALAAELSGYERSARAAHAEATDEQSKAENKYDTRGLEASYLARGQSRQAAEVAEQSSNMSHSPFATLDRARKSTWARWWS